MLLFSDGGIPLVLPPEDTDALADWLEAEYPDEFCASPSFEPDFVDSLCASGFIPMATRDIEGSEYLIPKLHTLRSVMDPRDILVTRTTRRESSRYVFGLDRRFAEVLDACVATHGEDWLRPPLRDAWIELFASRNDRRCRFSSLELCLDGRLVAGEIGVFAGACYTSLTGFRRLSGSGTVQLAAAARYLEAAGVGLWDLGMPLDYKAGLGAHNVSRGEFLALFRSARERVPLLTAGPYPARDLIEGRGGLVPASDPT
jgi:leucyl/phenylalanyl-tRNA--protein transferase